MGSFRELMRTPLEIEATSVCRNCANEIERRGGIWYASGGAVAADLCLKTSNGNHKPKPGAGTKTKAQLDREIEKALADKAREIKRDAPKKWNTGRCDECGEPDLPVRFIDDKHRTANVCAICVPKSTPS